MKRFVTISPSREFESCPVGAAAAALARGEMIIVHDESTCAMAVAAGAVDADVIVRLAREARGVINVCMSADRVTALGLRSQSGERGTRADQTISVDALDGTTAGISAADRARTIHALLVGDPLRLCSPGHIIPLRARDGATLAREGITEACVDLALLGGIEPVVAACGILDVEGDTLHPDSLRSTEPFVSLPAVSARAVRRHMRGAPVDITPDPAPFRDAMSMLVSGVAAITVRDESGRPKGMLATSVTSYSDRPPSVLISIAHNSRTHDLLLAAPGLGINILAAHQAEQAMVLASKSGDKFVDLDWTWDYDVPRILGALIYMRCSGSSSFVHRDHSVLIADVEYTEIDQGTPLVYFQRSFGWKLRPRDSQGG